MKDGWRLIWRVQTLELEILSVAMTKRDRSKASWRGVEVRTIGHSTRSFDELLQVLRDAGVTVLADVRTIPRSRHNPQFEHDALEAALRKHGLKYVHLAELGGLRHARADSPNAGWRNKSFRGYADYMLTAEFEDGLARLRAISEKGLVAVMCAEAVPWRCHRSLIADALTARGAHVEHLMSAGHASPHRMTSFAHVVGKRVTYPAGDVPLDVTKPFHLEATVRVLQRRPSNVIERWESERYRRVLQTEKGLALVEVVNHGSIDAPNVIFHVLEGETSAGNVAAIHATLRKMLGLDVDPAPFLELAKTQRHLAPIVAGLRGMRPPRFASLFEAFANVIPFQQVSLESGIATVRKLVERFGESVEHEGVRHFAFPEARVISESQQASLRACGFSERKAEALRFIAGKIDRGELTEKMLTRLPSTDALERLMELPSIGPWSAGLVLLRGLGRIDVFPQGDVGATKGLSTLMHVPPGPKLERLAERFGDVRGYLYFSALGASLLAKGLIHPAPIVGGHKTAARNVEESAHPAL